MGSPVVLDTSVLIAGLRSQRGASYRLLRLLADEALRIAITVPLFVEYEKAVSDLVRQSIIGEDDGEAILDFLAMVAERHEVFFLWRPLLRDPADEMVLEAAVVSGASTLVTHNTRDFRGSETLGVEVQTPGEFLAALRRSQ